MLFLFTCTSPNFVHTVLRACAKHNVFPSVRTSAAAAHKAEVVESGNLVLDGSRGVAKLCRVVLIVSCHHRNQGAVWNVAEGDHLVTCWRKQEKGWSL